LFYQLVTVVLTTITLMPLELVSSVPQNVSLVTVVTNILALLVKPVWNSPMVLVQVNVFMNNHKDTVCSQLITVLKDIECLPFSTFVSQMNPSTVFHLLLMITVSQVISLIMNKVIVYSVWKISDNITKMPVPNVVTTVLLPKPIMNVIVVLMIISLWDQDTVVHSIIDMMLPNQPDVLLATILVPNVLDHLKPIVLLVVLVLVGLIMIHPLVCVTILKVMIPTNVLQVG